MINVLILQTIFLAVLFCRSRKPTQIVATQGGMRQMNAAGFNELGEAEKQHFYRCKQCGEFVDMRQLDNVLFQEDHVPRPDMQYGGSPNK